MTETMQHRRADDDISPVNERLYDAARALPTAIMLVDHLGAEIVSVNVSANGHKCFLLAERPARLVGEISYENRHYRHWKAERYGVEIVWVERIQPEVA